MNTGKVITSAVTAGIIAGSGVIIAAVADGGVISSTSWTIGVITFLMAGAKDARTYLAEPPKS